MKINLNNLVVRGGRGPESFGKNWFFLKHNDLKLQISIPSRLIGKKVHIRFEEIESDCVVE